MPVNRILMLVMSIQIANLSFVTIHLLNVIDACVLISHAQAIVESSVDRLLM